MKALLLAIALILSACTSTRQTVAYMDSQLPSNTGKPCQRNIAGGLMRLDKGQSCLSQIRADAWLSRTMLSVQANESYSISVLPNQFWHDAKNRHTPPVGDEGSSVMSFFSSTKRHSGSKWFALMAVVVPPDRKDEQELTVQDLGVSSVINTTGAGQLAFYPNDANLSWIGRQRFYKNNHGIIWVKIENSTD